MKKILMSIGCLLISFFCFSPAFSVCAEESPLPAELEYEYTGDASILPIYPSDGSKGFSVEIKDSEGRVLAENVLYYTFDVGEYFLDYTIYKNEDITSPPGNCSIRVTVKDTVAPVITVGGSYARNYSVGGRVKIFPAVAVDVHDGEVTCTVSVSRGAAAVEVEDGTIEAIEGTYKITYSAGDSFGNKTEKLYTFTIGETEVKTSEENGCGSSLSAGMGYLLMATVALGALGLRRKKQ